MPSALRAFMCLCLLLIFSACAQNQDILNLNDQLISLNKRVTTLEESQSTITGSIDTKLGSGLETRLKTIYAAQAELRLEIDRLKGELNKLTGRVEDNDNLVKRTLEKDLSSQDNTKAEVAALATRIQESEKAIKHLEDDLRAGLEAVAKAPATIAEQSPTTTAASASAPGSGATAAKEEDLYNNGLNLFKEGKIDEALKSLKGFMEKYPKSELADNAQFWIGECYMSKKQYDLAILAYQDVIKNHPNANKVPNAILRQGVAAELYGDKKLARALYKKLIEKFPTTSEAKTAKERLAKLG